MPCGRPPAGDHSSDEEQLTDLDADIEKEQRDRNRRLRQANLAQRAGETESVQQSERERDHPRPPFGQARLALPGTHNFRATNTILRAMHASTGGCGTWTHPSVAAVSVRLWVAVKAVIVATTRFQPVTRHSIARMYNR